MIRCALVELLLPGAGYALGGRLRAAIVSVAVAALLLLSCLFTPWPVLMLLPARMIAAIDAGRRGRRGPPVEGWQWKPMLLVGAVSLGTTMALRLSAMEAFAIPSVSMTPTLMLDDKIMVDKVSIYWRGPERGEVVAFWMGERTFVKRVIALGGDHVAVRGGVLYINGKEVPRRALGPATYQNRDESSGVEMTEHTFAYEERYAGRTFRVFDDQPDAEPLHDYPSARGSISCGGNYSNPPPGTLEMTPDHDGACVVPPGGVFLMGDNRNNSNDSRYWGAMAEDKVFGRVVGVWLGGKGRRLSRVGNVE